MKNSRYSRYEKRLNAQGWRDEDARSFPRSGKLMTSSELAATSSRIDAAKKRWIANADGTWMNDLNGVLVTVDPRTSDPTAEVL